MLSTNATPWTRNVLRSDEVDGLVASDDASTDDARSEPLSSRRRVSILAKLVREPLLHFLLIAAVLSGINQYIATSSGVTRITVTQEQVRRLADKYRTQYGVKPTPEQLDALVESHIKEEIFYNEALKLGLHVDDEVVRRRLVQKYEFLQQDLEPLPEPTPAELMQYYQDHLDRYVQPETVTFTHVYFSPDKRGEEGARRAAEQWASTLNRRGVSRAVEIGDRFPGPYDFASLSREGAARVFGNSALVEEVFGPMPERRWSEPFRSGLGWHTVYITSRSLQRQASFEEVREKVRSDYLEWQRQRRNDALYARVRQNYEIVRQ
ncbi:MAG TPA: peptidylprolyl isomerase [Steroidobacter sp.]